jgi:hypothetical protein
MGNKAPKEPAPTTDTYIDIEYCSGWGFALNAYKLK